MSDLISRQAAIDALRDFKTEPGISDDESEIEGYNDGLDMAISVLSNQPYAEPDYDLDGYSSRLWKAAHERGKVEAGRKKPEQPESAKEYCEECEHIEMCSWYPYEGCEFRSIDTYARGYNDAKREIALSGEYERAYQRGKADAERKKGRPYLKKIGGEYGYWACSQCHEPISICANYCSHCGAKMGGDADADTN